MEGQQFSQNSKNITNVSLKQGSINVYMQGIQDVNNKNSEDSINSGSHVATFEAYVHKAIDHFSMKKTLLYEHQPHSFYELYVCNNLAYYKSQIDASRSRIQKSIIADATPHRLEEESKYIVISGTGGIGKSMFLTHMFLSSAQEYTETQTLPIFVALKDYTDKTSGILDFIFRSIKSFSPKIAMADLIRKLESEEVFLMLDGFDELQSSLREKFNAYFDEFIRAYSGNSVIITSRPVDSFVSYAKFSVFKIEPLTKQQAIRLISKLSY